jgi:dimethylaniline monooxygenase (N-oxide forming)
VRRAVRPEPAPPVDLHHLLATTLADASGVAPDLLARPELTEPLLFGPLLAPRYRLDGPGAQPAAEQRFTEQLAGSPRPPRDPGDTDRLRRLGLGVLADAVLDRAPGR